MTPRVASTGVLRIHGVLGGAALGGGVVLAGLPDAAEAAVEVDEEDADGAGVVVEECGVAPTTDGVACSVGGVDTAADDGVGAAVGAAPGVAVGGAGVGEGVAGGTLLSQPAGTVTVLTIVAFMVVVA